MALQENSVLLLCPWLHSVLNVALPVPSIMYFDREKTPTDLIIEKLHLNKTVSTLNPKNLSVISCINVAHFYKITTKAFLE